MTIRNRLLDLVSPVTLNITAADIDAARRNDDNTMNCPAQRVAERRFAPLRAFVGPQYVRVQDEDGTLTLFDGGWPLRFFTERWDSTTRIDGAMLDTKSSMADPTRIRLHRCSPQEYYA